MAALTTLARRGVLGLPRSVRSTAAAAVTARRTYGGLSDDDRIFQNIYGQRDWGLKGALKRVGWGCGGWGGAGR